MSEISGHGSEINPENWSVLDGEYPETAVVDELSLDGIDQLIEHMGDEAALKVGVANAVISALEASNPSLPPEASTLAIKTAKYVVEKYQKKELDTLRNITHELDSNAPAVIKALDAIFALYEGKKIGGLDIKARAYATVRAIYLIQSDRTNELPQPLDETVQ